MPDWLTPKEVAAARRIRVAKVLSWIASGELQAVNLAQGRGGRPRWRVSVEAVDAFERGRSNRAAARQLNRQQSRHVRRVGAPSVIEFF